MKEIWKDIPGYGGFYQASTRGRIRRIRGHGRRQTRILKQLKNRRYNYVGIFKKSVRVHRLVAITFIPNNKNKPCVNHKNFNPKDNRVENLEWCTHKENTAHSDKAGRLNLFKKACQRQLQAGSSKMRAIGLPLIFATLILSACGHETSPVNYGYPVVPVSGPKYSPEPSPTPLGSPSPDKNCHWDTQTGRITCLP